MLQQSRKGPEIDTDSDKESIERLPQIAQAVHFRDRDGVAIPQQRLSGMLGSLCLKSKSMWY
jgi:hypothetical protein